MIVTCPTVSSSSLVWLSNISVIYRHEYIHENLWESVINSGPCLYLNWAARGPHNLFSNNTQNAKQRVGVSVKRLPRRAITLWSWARLRTPEPFRSSITADGLSRGRRHLAVSTLNCRAPNTLLINDRCPPSTCAEIKRRGLSVTFVWKPRGLERYSSKSRAVNIS